MKNRGLALLFALTCSAAQAQTCFKTSVLAPSPFMGNHGESFRTADGAKFEVVGSYEYLNAHSPKVIICPSRGKMLVEGKTIGFNPVRPPTLTSQPKAEQESKASSTDAPVTVVFRARDCSYFVADGPRGHYILEWYGGYDPDRGDGIFGEFSEYGFKDVLYGGGQEGRVNVDDFLLSKDTALEKLREKCR